MLSCAAIAIIFLMLCGCVQIDTMEPPVKYKDGIEFPFYKQTAAGQLIYLTFIPQQSKALSIRNYPGGLESVGEAILPSIREFCDELVKKYKGDRLSQNLLNRLKSKFNPKAPELVVYFEGNANQPIPYYKEGSDGSFSYFQFEPDKSIAKIVKVVNGEPHYKQVYSNKINELIDNIVKKYKQIHLA